MERGIRKWLMIMSAAVIATVTPLAAQPRNEKFDIKLPAGFSEFAKQVQTAESPEGTVETTNWVSRADTGEAVVITVSKMPAQILDPDKLIDATRDSLLKSLKATLEKEEDLEGDQKATVLQFRSESESPVYLQSKLAVDEDHFYQVLYVGRTAEQRAAPAVAQLFSSFRVIEAQ